MDDAYISLVYADNLAQGHGLVFHPALPVTEGYSNLLWTLLLALGLLLGAPGAALAQALGLIFSAVAVGLVALRVGGARGAAIGLAIAASPIVGYWAGRGMESGLVTLLIVLALTRLGRRGAWIAFGLLGLTRVEGVVWGGIAVLHSLIRARRLPPLRSLALWLGPFGLQLALRWALYGALTPAPVLAKTSDAVGSSVERGLIWLADVLVGAPLGVVALGVAVVFSARTLREGGRAEALWAIVTILGMTSFAVLVGGDWMPNLRWLAPVVPLVWLAAATAAPSWRPLIPLALLSMVLDAQTGVIGASAESARRSPGTTRETLTHGPMPVAVHPAALITLETLGQDEVILHPDVGLLAWLTGNPVLDPQGLTWADLAVAMHDGWQGEAGAAQLETIRAEIRRLRPALIAVPIRDGRRAVGPVGAATLGSGEPTEEAWFAEGWERWREAPYAAGGMLRYYLRKDLGEKLGKEARLARYADALERAPEASVLRVRQIWTLRQLGRDAEARALEDELDPRATRLKEIWSR